MILGKRAYEPDDIDLKLLEMLQADAKTPLAKLGEEVGLSAPSVMERLRKMEAAGVIMGYSAIVDGKKIGLDITAFVGVGFNYPKAYDEFARAVSSLPNVLECHHVTGGHTMILKVKTQNTASLERLISEIRSMPGVERTETMVVLSTLLETTQLSFDEVEEAPAPRSASKQPVRSPA